MENITLNRDLYNILKISDCSLKAYEVLAMKVLEKMKHKFSIGGHVNYWKKDFDYLYWLSIQSGKNQEEVNIISCLNLEFIFPGAILDEILDPMDVDITDFKKLSGSKKFSLCSERHKRRKTKPLRELDPEELCYTTKMSLKSSWNIIDASKIVEHVCLRNTEDAPPRVRKLCANWWLHARHSMGTVFFCWAYNVSVQPAVW
jgi:hypothetical protein